MKKKNYKKKLCLQSLKIKLIKKNTSEIEITNKFYPYFNQIILKMKIEDSKVYDNIDKKNIICFKHNKLNNKKLYFCFLNKKTLKNKTIKMFYTEKKTK